MTRFIAAAGFAGLLWAALNGSAAASEAWPAEVAPELRRIQRELGGSVVREFGELRPLEPSATPAAKPPAAGAAWEQRAAIDALREAAEQLDMSANRLERYELYKQADGLRAQSQRLRLDARRMNGGRRQESRVEPALPRPQLESVPTPSRPQLAPGIEEAERGRDDRPAIEPTPAEPEPLRE